MFITFLNLGLHGKLSNQAFQYATMKGFAKQCGLNPLLPMRTTDLEKEYNISCIKMIPSQLSIKWDSIEEQTFFYRNLKIKNNTSICGYFQSEKYFNFIREDILKEFTLKNPGNIYETIEKLKEQNKILIGLHVRRGDYLLPQYSHVHPTCDVDYYKRAINYIQTKLNIHSNNFLFVICSDDIEWCKENFGFLKNVYFSENRTGPQEQILMSLCEHNIIANSSFSWWSAWLNQNSNKVVVAPKKWFNVDDPQHDTRDLYCEGWHKE